MGAVVQVGAERVAQACQLLTSPGQHADPPLDLLPQPRVPLRCRLVPHGVVAERADVLAGGTELGDQVQEGGGGGGVTVTHPAPSSRFSLPIASVTAASFSVSLAPLNADAISLFRVCFVSAGMLLNQHDEHTPRSPSLIECRVRLQPSRVQRYQTVIVRG